MFCFKLKTKKASLVQIMGTDFVVTRVFRNLELKVDILAKRDCHLFIPTWINTEIFTQSLSLWMGSCSAAASSFSVVGVGMKAGEDRESGTGQSAQRSRLLHIFQHFAVVSTHQQSPLVLVFF